MNKRGIRHLELIEAVIIFIFAVTVVIVYISVAGTRIETKPAVLDFLESSLRNEAEINFYTTNIFLVSDPTSSDCFKILKHPDIPTDKNSISIKKEERTVAFDVNSNNLLIENQGSGFYQLYFFDENMFDWSSTLSNCEEIPAGSYDYSLKLKDSIFSEKKLKEIKKKIEIKNEDSDFEVTVKEQGDSILNLTGEEEPPAVRVYAKEFLTDMLFEDGRISEVKINLRVW